MAGWYTDPGKSNESIAEVKEILAKQFDMENYTISWGETGEVCIGQPVYAANIVQKFGMEHTKPVNTPVDSSTKLVKSNRRRRMC